MDERNRLIEFRQMKSRIRGSSEYLVVGIDIAKMRHHAFFGTSAGRTLMKNLAFDNTKEGFEKLLLHAETIKRQHVLGAIIFGMEPTADYHKPLGEYLIRKEYMTVLVLGNAVKKNRELLDGRWDKHDTKDAANIADLVGQGKCLFYENPSEEIQQIRSYLSLQHRLKKLERALKTRIRNHLIAQYFPELDCSFKHAEVQAIVRIGLDPQSIARMPLEEFTAHVASRRATGAQRLRIKKIRDTASHSIGTASYPATTWEGTLLMGYVTAVQTMIRTVEEKLTEICSTLPEYASLMSIPGFGPYISAMVIGAIGNPHRFDNARQVLKTAGLDISSQRSGTRTDAPYIISKRGKAQLRYALYQAARIASQQNRCFMQYFTNKLSGREREKGIITKMLVKLSAKLLVIAWTLMKKKEVFDPGYIRI